MAEFGNLGDLIIWSQCTGIVCVVAELPNGQHCHRIIRALRPLSSNCELHTSRHVRGERNARFIARRAIEPAGWASEEQARR